MRDTSINDLIKTALTLEGYSGDLNQQIFTWLGFEGCNSPSLSDRWQQFFDIKLIPDGHRQDREMSWLQSEGHLQDALDDRRYEYWLDRATP